LYSGGTYRYLDVVARQSCEIVLANIGKQIAITIDVDDFADKPGWVMDDFGDVELDEAR